MKINNLTYSYNGKDNVLKHINMDLDKGKIIGVIGINGSGKSTLFLNIVGVLKPTSGEIIYENKKVVYDKKSLYALRKKVGIVFQDPDKQIFYADVYDDIAFALRNLGLDEETIKGRVEEALRRVDGLQFKNKAVQFLSYGQKKRIAIASILAMEQEVVLLDEPTAGLDPKSVESMISIIEDMKRVGTKVLLSSHDMDLIYRVCDYIYVIDDGSIISEGTLEEVFSKDNHMEEIGLGEPWLVKVHKYMGLPLFKTEEGLYAYYNKNKEVSSYKNE